MHNRNEVPANSQEVLMMRPHKVGFAEAVARLLLAALLLGLLARGIWEAVKLGWSLFGAVA